jgi:hypothetical protein
VNRFAVAATLALLPLVTAGAQEWRTLDVSRQLRDSAEHLVRVRYGAGRFTLRPTSDPVLFSMQLRYDEARMRPMHEYSPDARTVTLGVEGEAERWTRVVRNRDESELRLQLSDAVPLELRLELGATEARMDAGGLALSALRIETGAADAVLDFSTPNRTRMRVLDLQLGAASFVLTNLGNANVDRIRVDGGVGSVDLDFGGAISRDVDIESSVALGRFALHLPSDVGIRVEVRRVLAGFQHPGLVRRGDAFYSDNWDSAKIRMRVRAETVFGAVEVHRDR